MKAMIKPLTSRIVIDPRLPWKLPRPDGGFPKYPGKKSVREWKELLQKARHGDAEAEYLVASHYENGCKDRRGRILVRCNVRAAAKWYRRAAEHGSVSAQNTLGVILGGNYGVRRNARKALFWLKKAYRGDDTWAASNNIAITYRESSNFRQAVQWFKIAVAAGDSGDLVQLGVHYFWGKGVRTNYATAVRYYRKAIQKIDRSWYERDDAFFYLGIAYLEGKGVKQSLAKARQCLERANRDGDHAAAQRLLKRLAKVSSKQR